MVREEGGPTVVLPPGLHHAVEHRPLRHAALNLGLKGLQAARVDGEHHRLHRHGQQPQQQPRHPVGVVLRGLEALHQPQHAPLVRKRGCAGPQHEKGKLVDEEQRAPLGLVTANDWPLSLAAGPPLPVYAGNAEQHAVLATHAGEVLVGVGGGLAAERHELAQARQRALSLVVARAARGERDQAAAEDAAARGRAALFH